MRRRLLLALLPLLLALLAALEVPLAQSHAARLTQALFIDSIGDAQRFAGLADQTMHDVAGRGPLEQEVRHSAQLRNRTVTIVDQENEPVLRHDRGGSRAVRAALRDALAGRDPHLPDTAWPWRKDPIVVALPIGQDANIIGAVAVEAPTTKVRERVADRIALLAGGGLSVLLLATALGALPVARWVLRPVDELSATAARLTAGDLSARVSERGGPPELRGLAVAFNRMASSLVTALERQRAFVADASHELRTPLATLRLRIEALTGKLSGDGERELSLALDESDRLARTLTRMLTLARSEASAAERADFDVVALMTRRLDAWAPLFVEIGSAVRVDACDEAWAHGSVEAVEYALDVLLENACAYAPGSPVDIAVTVGTGSVELCVRDHGSGVSAADACHIGERFWRSTHHRGIPGTGLGLATARSLLESGGGRLDVSVAVHGLAATLWLPAATGPGRDTTAPPQGAAPADTPSTPTAS
jgi:signal transduction histidine kinase